MLDFDMLLYVTCVAAVGDKIIPLTTANVFVNLYQSKYMDDTQSYVVFLQASLFLGIPFFFFVEITSKLYYVLPFYLVNTNK